MKILALAALSGALALGAAASHASAYVACNAQGDCWHTDYRDHYPGVRYRPDDYYFHQDWGHDPNRHWRDRRDGRGRYDNGAWSPREGR